MVSGMITPMKKYFIAGLLFWLPVWATYVVLRFLFELLDSTIQLLPNEYQPTQLLGHHIPGLGIVLVIVIVFLTGMLVTNIIGHRFVQLWEKLLSRIPIIRSIYTAVKQVANAFFKPSDESFRKVLLVEYPRKGVWSIGFQTSGHFHGAPNQQETVTVFIPTTPNPTSGFLIIVPVEQATVLNISIEEAFKMIVSLGVVMPKHELSTQPNV